MAKTRRRTKRRGKPQVRRQAKRQSKRPVARKHRPRILIVEARFYDHISDMLLRGAARALAAGGASHDRITVPGALEIPGAVAIALDAANRRLKPYDGVVALGCVIRGDTYHFEIVANQSARALMDLSVSGQIPVGNGILTVDTEIQATTRASMDEGDKGGAAARAALAMVKLKRGLAGR